MPPESRVLPILSISTDEEDMNQPTKGVPESVNEDACFGGTLSQPEGTLLHGLMEQ